MKEKKIVLSVILGVSLVTLITALVACLADGLSLMIDSTSLESIHYFDHLNYTIGASEIVLTGLGIAFVTLFCCLKNKRNKVCFILAAVLVGYFLISSIVLRCLVPRYISIKGSFTGINEKCYTMVMSYIATSITITVSAVLVCVSTLLLAKEKKEEEANSPESNSISAN